MVTIPTIDMVKTGQHITELRVQAGAVCAAAAGYLWIFHTAGAVQVAAWNGAADNRQSGRAGSSARREGR